MAGISKGGVSAAAKFKAGMTKYLKRVTPPGPAPRQPSGTGPGAAKARRGLGIMVARSQPARAVRRKPGSGPGIVKARAGLEKAWGHLG
jgi:hypothetical protein